MWWLPHTKDPSPNHIVLIPTLVLRLSCGSPPPLPPPLGRWPVCPSPSSSLARRSSSRASCLPWPASTACWAWPTPAYRWPTSPRCLTRPWRPSCCPQNVFSFYISRWGQTPPAPTCHGVSCAYSMCKYLPYTACWTWAQTQFIRFPTVLQEESDLWLFDFSLTWVVSLD